jgi:hypothetical protein
MPGGFLWLSVPGSRREDHVQARTPVENIVAAIDAVHEFNGSR